MDSDVQMHSFESCNTVRVVTATKSTAVVGASRLTKGQSFRKLILRRPASDSGIFAFRRESRSAPSSPDSLDGTTNDDCDEAAELQLVTHDDVFFPSELSARAEPDMQRTKLLSTSSSASRLVSVPKALWKSRAKSQSRVAARSSSGCSWIPQGNCQWRAGSGHRLTVLPTTVLALTEIERIALQQLALAKLQAKNLGCRIEIPKEDSAPYKKPKRRPVLLRKRAVTTSYLEANEKDIPSEGLVFGIPLRQCIENDRLNRQRVPSLLREKKTEPTATSSRSTEDVSTSWLSRSESLGDASFASTGDDRIGTGTREETYGSRERLRLRKPSAVELERLEALRGPSNADGWSSALFDYSPQVPYVVNSCFKHIETYGLHTLGIFRVSTSKKRIRQLREDFDSGKDVKLNEDHHPHDVAQLLKEFFRDMPEPLLTRQLYQAFLATLKVSNLIQRIETLKLLVRLLPVPNRDTLWALLNFLAKVAEHAVDVKGKTGERLSGNKMDPHNLATLFGPNLLRMTRTGKDVEFLVETAKRAEERCDVILVVRCLIENSDKLFDVSSEEMDAVYKKLMVDDPETLDVLLRHRFFTVLELQTGTDVQDGICTTEEAADSPDWQFRGRQPTKDSLAVLDRHVPSIRVSSDASRARQLADDKSSIDSDEFVLVVATAKGREHLQIQNFPETGRRQSSTTSDELSCDYPLTNPTYFVGENRLVPPQIDGRRHPSKSPGRKVEKSASTSMLQSVFASKPKKEKRKQEAAMKSSNATKPSEQHAKQQSLYPLSKSKSTMEHRPSTSLQQPSCSGTPPLSSILANDRPRQRTRQQSTVRFPQERWKRWEIIASEYTEESGT